MKNKKLYYFLSYTWGIIMILVGLCVELVFTVFKIPHVKHGPCRVYRIGKSWGGLSLGHTIIASNAASVHTLNHEFGHSIQNAILGPLFPFVVCIPSATRYWLRNFKTDTSKLIYVTILTLCAGSISIGLMAFGMLVSAIWWFQYIGLAFYTYTVVIFLWLIVYELPKYRHAYVDYDSIWFEGTATKWGTKYIAYFK